jgi:hypothetical protein
MGLNACVSRWATSLLLLSSVSGLLVSSFSSHPAMRSVYSPPCSRVFGGTAIFKTPMLIAVTLEELVVVQVEQT